MLRQQIGKSKISFKINISFSIMTATDPIILFKLRHNSRIFLFNIASCIYQRMVERKITIEKVKTILKNGSLQSAHSGRLRAI